MRASVLVFVAVAACPLLLALACNSSDDGASGSSDDVSDIGICPSGNGASPINGRYPVAAVPSGGLCAAATSCHLPVDDCPGDWPPVSSRTSEYECDCASGAWSCFRAVEGTSECPADAGAPDASLSDASDDGSTNDAREDVSTRDASDDASDASANDSATSAVDAGPDAFLDGAADAATVDAASDAALSTDDASD